MSVYRTIGPLVCLMLQGQWSDVAGRRFSLLVCLFMSALGYSMFTMATTVTIMFVARIPLGEFLVHYVNSPVQ